MKGLLLSIVMLTSAASCARPSAARSSADAAVRALSHAEVERLAVQHCAECHQSSVSRAKPAALAVFDLDQATWCAGLSSAQFTVFYQRMQGELEATTRARLLAFTEGAARRSAH
jgi:hypothetical protein